MTTEEAQATAEMAVFFMFCSAGFLLIALVLKDAFCVFLAAAHMGLVGVFNTFLANDQIDGFREAPTTIWFLFVAGSLWACYHMTVAELRAGKHPTITGTKPKKKKKEDKD